MPDRFRKPIRSLTLLLLIVAAMLAGRRPAFAWQQAQKPAPAASQPAVDTTEEWQVVYIGNTRVGYARSTEERGLRDGRMVINSHTETALSIARFGQKVSLKMTLATTETEQGDLLEFTSTMENSPSLPTINAGAVRNGSLELTSNVGGKTSRSTARWNPELKSPAYQDRLLRENPLKPGEKRSFKTFDPQFNKEVTVTMEAADYEETKLLGGQSQRLLKVAVVQSIAPQLVQYVYLDRQQRALKSTTSMVGTLLTTYAVKKEQALEALTGEEVDLAIATLVKTSKIERSAQTRSVVYRITIPGEDPLKAISSGPTQSITRIDDHTIDLKVRSVEPPATAEGAQPVDAEFIEPNEFLQSNDPLVQKHAAAAAGEEKDPWLAARGMERWVHTNLKNKNFSTLLASAAEVAKDLSGDCTEHACLLAAMCRAKGIPSRVAVGLVYVPRDSSFGGHMWTEVYVNGAWVPLDATLGHGKVAADHIKFSDSSFSSRDGASGLVTFLPIINVLGKMRIEVKQVEH
jgi:hypothetical protein